MLYFIDKVIEKDRLRKCSNANFASAKHNLAHQNPCQFLCDQLRVSGWVSIRARSARRFLGEGFDGLMQNLADNFLGNSLTQEPIYAGRDFHVGDAQYLAVLVHDGLNVGRETGLVWHRRGARIHLRTLRDRRRSVTGTSFLVLSAEYGYLAPFQTELGRSGVGDGDRTRDIRCHRPTLYQLSYAHQRVNRGQFTLKPASIEMGGEP